VWWLTQLLQRTASAAATEQQKRQAALGPLPALMAKSPMNGPISLIRWHWFSEVGALIPGTGEFQSFKRKRNHDGPPYWLPQVPTHGYFDYIDGAFVAVYRAPEPNDPLWFQIGAQRFALTDTTRSNFSPTFSHGEPLIDNAEVERRLQLFEGATLLLDRSYRLKDREKRLHFSIDPFPSWPDEEANYDLCYHVHRMLQSGGWRHAFKTVRQQ
jgi:hypothetical protein